MSASLEDVGGQSGGPKIREFLSTSFNDDGSLKTGGGDKLGLSPTGVKTVGYTASAGDLVPVDTTGGNVTVTLPTSPQNGSVVAVKQVTRGGSNTVTVACGGSDVLNKTGGATSLTLTLLDQSVILQYRSSGAIWYVVTDGLELAQLDARYGAATGVFNVKATYGARGDGSTNDRAAIQAAIDAANAAFVATGSGQVVYFPAGVYVTSAAASPHVGRTYSLLLKSGVTLLGDSSLATTIIADTTTTDYDVVTTDRTTTSSNVGVKGFTIDGRSASKAQVTPSMNLWLYAVTDLMIDDVRSNNGSNWNSRIELCDRVRINGWGTLSNTGDFENSDGLHFTDTSNVSGSNINIHTESDDAFCIQANAGDVSGYAISGLYVTAPSVAGSNGGRGISIVCSESVSAVRTISNVNIQATIKNTTAHSAIQLHRASYRNVHIDAVVDGCLHDLYLDPGFSAGANGTMENCSFDIVASNSGGESIVVVDTNATTGIVSNRIDALVTNPGGSAAVPASGPIGAEIRGSYWSGSVAMDYDPNVEKIIAKQLGVVLYVSSSTLAVVCRDADVNLQMQSGAIGNTIHLGKLAGGVTHDLVVASGSTGNHFFGGSVGDLLNSGGATNIFYGVAGVPSGMTVNTQTGTTYTPVLSDGGNIVACANASPFTFTIPANSSVAYPIGTEITVIGTGNGLVTFAVAGGVTLNVPGGSSLTMAKNQVGRLVKINTNTWNVLWGARPPDSATLAVNGSGQMVFLPTADVSMNSHKLTALARATANGDAVGWPWPTIGGVLDVQTFRAGTNQTWNNPLVGTIAVVYIKGASAGGGGGVNSASAGNPRSGGAGGGGCGWVVFAVPVAALAATCNVNVATGGVGGTAGNPGGNASGTTAFDTAGGNARVTAATGGAAGSSGASSGGTGGVATAPTYAGYSVTATATNGGVGGDGTTAASPGTNGGATSGGAAGGGVSTTPTGQNGGQGAVGTFTVGTGGAAGVGGAAGSLTQGAPSIGAPFVASVAQSCGGSGGGGCHTNGNGGARGANGYSGGGGGGGGSCVNGPAGLGGDGDDGFVMVVVYE